MKKRSPHAERAFDAMRTHELKTWPEPFEAVIAGVKKFEIRKNDRHFQVGDTVILREYDPERRVYTGRETRKCVSYILYGGQWEMPEHLCVFGWIN